MSFVQKQLAGDRGFGDELRALRELRGLTQHELSEQTKIHVSVIQALEEERLIDLKDPVYTERHVRILVQCLEGHLGYYLAKYRALLDTKHVRDPGSMVVRPTARRRDFFVLSRVVMVLVFFALIGLAAAYLLWQAHVLQRAPRLDVRSPVDGMELSAPRVDVEGDTEPDARVRINGQLIVVDVQGHFRVSFDIPRGLTTFVIETQRRYGSSTTVIRRVSYDRLSAATTSTTGEISSSSTTSTLSN